MAALPGTIVPGSPEGVTLASCCRSFGARIMTILEQIAAGQGPAIMPLSVEQYHQMIANDILREGDSIELIDGILVRKDRADEGGDPMSHGPRHAFSVKRLQRLFREVEGRGYHLHSQLPVTLGGIQEPEPDLALVRGREEDYERRHPAAADLAAIMEVSDSSLTWDRTTKLSPLRRRGDSCLLDRQFGGEPD